MVSAPGRILGVLNWIGRKIISRSFNLVSFLQTGPDVVAFSVYGGINLVGHFTVALIFLKADVVCARSNPNSLSIPCKWCFPDAEVVTAGHHGKRFSHLISKILHAAVEIELTHRHAQI